MKRITVLCTTGCGTWVETSPSHKHNALCKECRRKSNIASTRCSQMKRQGKDVTLEVPTAEQILRYAYWGN